MPKSNTEMQDNVQGELIMWCVSRKKTEQQWSRDDFMSTMRTISVVLQRKVSNEEKCNALLSQFKSAATDRHSCAEIYWRAYRIACKLVGITGETDERTA